MLHVDTCCNVSQFCQDPSQCIEEDDTVDNVVQSTSAGHQMFEEDTVLMTRYQYVQETSVSFICECDCHDAVLCLYSVASKALRHCS